MRNPASEDGSGRERGRRLRPAARIVVGLLFMAVAGFVALSWSSVTAIRGHPGFAGASTTDTDVSQVEFGGCRLKVPATYLNAPIPAKDDHRKELLLQALWPSMEGRTAENWRHFNVGDHGRIIRMLIKDYTNSPVSAQGGVATRYKIRTDFSAPMEEREPFDGLEHLVPVGQGSFLSRTELFLERTLAGDLRSLIACSPDGSVPFPHCTHWFAIGDEILAEVTYGKPYFRQWREIRSGVIALLERFADETIPCGRQDPNEAP